MSNLRKKIRELTGHAKYHSLDRKAMIIGVGAGMLVALGLATILFITPGLNKIVGGLTLLGSQHKGNSSIDTNLDVYTLVGSSVLGAVAGVGVGVILKSFLFMEEKDNLKDGYRFYEERLTGPLKLLEQVDKKAERQNIQGQSDSRTTSCFSSFFKTQPIDSPSSRQADLTAPFLEV